MSLRFFMMPLYVAAVILSSNPIQANPVNPYFTTSAKECSVSALPPLVPEAYCPPITNLEVEFVPNGKVFASWDSIDGVQEYAVTVYDGNGGVFIDTLAHQNPYILLDGFEPGQNYTIRVCYDCPKAESSICNSLGFEYIIIEEVVIMMEVNPCDCNELAPINGPCPVSGNALYDLTDDGVYAVSTLNPDFLTFRKKGFSVNPLNNCQHNYSGMAQSQHGPVGSQILSYYKLGSVDIHFHGLNFCVSGSGSETVYRCPLSKYEKTGKRDGTTETPTDAYPNPFSESLTLKLHSIQSDSKVFVQLTNGSGQQILRKELYFATTGEVVKVLSTQDLPTGLYWLQVWQDGVQQTSRQMVKVD